jgi:DNA uptake protein ComE-like DNA-binding protein
MKMGSDEYDALTFQLSQVSSIKTFNVELKNVTQRTPVVPAAPSVRRRGTRPQQQVAFKTTSVSPTEALVKQAKDFSKLFHSSMIDTEMLAKPTVESDLRKESALKYMSLWGTTQVNINTSTRQVLESALVFGGNAKDIAAEIIKQRREKPFASIDELKKKLFGYSASIDKCKSFITTSSNIFSIRVTATSGTAKASAVIVVLRENDKIEKIAVISG